ncbi:hypothetical protein J3B02_003609 [Coemansia erecta]|nr:hypothetical protein J3B02_003609 [Coemansia erecta]KAJ2860986.1 hypothetical protein FB639_005559 [Coemansia asiatica]
MTYPPPSAQPMYSGAHNPAPQGYTDQQVEDIRRQRISYVKRNAYISLGLQIAFTAVFAALLGYYINRERNLSRYDDSWFRWYIGLLIALLVIDLLCIAYTYWQMVRKLRWLRDPATPKQAIVSGGDTLVIFFSNPQNAQPNPNAAAAYNYGQPQPGYPQPGYPQPGYPQPGYPQPGYTGAGNQGNYNPPAYPPPSAQYGQAYSPDSKGPNDPLNRPIH